MKSRSIRGRDFVCAVPRRPKIVHVTEDEFSVCKLSDPFMKTLPLSFCATSICSLQLRPAVTTTLPHWGGAGAVPSSHAPTEVVLKLRLVAHDSAIGTFERVDDTVPSDQSTTMMTLRQILILRREVAPVERGSESWGSADSGHNCRSLARRHERQSQSPSDHQMHPRPRYRSSL